MEGATYRIHAAQGLLVEPAFPLGDVGLGLGQETAGEWAVGVEGHV